MLFVVLISEILTRGCIDSLWLWVLRLSAHQTELYSTKFLVVSVCLFEGFIEKAEDYNKRGRVECQEGRFEKACQQFTSALKCLPSNLEDDIRLKYLCNRAGCYLKLVSLT